METKTVVKVLSKHMDHVDGIPMMCYKFEVVYDQSKAGRCGELIIKYYAKDPLFTKGQIVALEDL